MARDTKTEPEPDTQPEPEQEPRQEPRQEPEPEAPAQLATTMMTKDYLGRPLTNATPGTSQATDHLGRNVVVSDRDYLARLLVA